jgi:hypothetical protein
MDNQPSFDRELQLPILVGGFSILGIIAILLIGRLNASREPVPAVETATPFKYIFLGTEPINPTGSAEASETEVFTALPFESATPGLPDTPPVFVTPALGTPQLITPVNTPSSSPTSTSASGAPLGSGTFDDVDSHLLYGGPWISQTGITGAYLGTLHVSQVIESSLTFRFIGRELRLFYQGNPSQGIVTIIIDGQEFTLDQSDGSEWISASLTNNTHSVLITHTRGGSINFDYVIIPEVPPTGTPTATPTRTPRP